MNLDALAETKPLILEALAQVRDETLEEAANKCEAYIYAAAIDLRPFVALGCPNVIRAMKEKP